LSFVIVSRSFVLVYKNKVSCVDYKSHALPDNEYRIFSMYSINKKQCAANKAEIPEINRYNALLFFLGIDPLGKETHKKAKLCKKSKYNPIVYCHSSPFCVSAKMTSAKCYGCLYRLAGGIYVRLLYLFCSIMQRILFHPCYSQKINERFYRSFSCIVF